MVGEAPAGQPSPGLQSAQQHDKLTTSDGSKPRPGPSEHPEKSDQEMAEAPSNPHPSKPDQAKTARPGREHAPELGTRIEVLWRIETDEPADDGSESTMPTVQDRWWGAVVQDCTNERVGAAAQPQHPEALVHVLLYDAYGEFEEDTARVVFLPDRTLVDLARLDDEDRGMLDWRLEGTTDVAPEPAVPLTMAQFANQQEEIVQQAGLSSDADLQVLRQFPANVQLHMTSGYRAFADGVKGMLTELMAKKPSGYVVTEADVQEIFAKIQASKKPSG